MGTLYVVIGMAAGLEAFDRLLLPADFTGAFALLGRWRAGVVLAVVVVVGLGGQAAWLLTRALLDPEREAHGWVGRASRAGSLVGALMYLALGWAAVRVLWAGPRHPTDPGGDRSARDWSAAVMGHPAGPWAVAAVGVGFVAYAGYGFHRAWHGEFDGRLDPGRLLRQAGWWADHVSRFGMVARAVLLGLVGAFLVAAAARHEPAAAHGLGGTLAALRADRRAAWVYPVLAAGMIA
jgi:hypothetical protein